MKKVIITTGIVASSMLYNNTVTAKNSNNSYITSAYEWTVETEFDVFTGTCESINEVNREIAHVTKEKKILRKNIMPIPLINDALEETETIYTWDVVTNNGHSFGTSTNLEEAQSIINSFTKEDVLKSSIVESHITSK
jgi:hypothetical protein